VDDELTAWENMEIHSVLYGISRTERKGRIEELLKFVELWERRDDYVKNYSGGMKRRLEIARGLLHQPEILFLDEPTLGLDPQTRIHIWDYIKKMNQESGMTVFFTTHYIEEADKMAQRAAIIDHGRIVTIGSPAELKKQTNADSLEGAFLELTGKDMRAEQGSARDRMRRMGEVMKR
jgi:ABC-2 type transport system ATP-binding protein